MRKEMSDYHKRQIQKPYRSTEVFAEWLTMGGYLKDDAMKICDMACGMGANVMYLANKFPNIKFVGIDLENELVEEGNEILRQNIVLNNCMLYQGDWYNLDKNWIDKFDGIISFQTLSWLPEYTKPLKKLTELNPKWIAISSLFYDGDIDYTIKLKDYYRPTKENDYEEMYYNIYSLDRVKKYLNELGYSRFDYIPYEIDIDLPKTTKDIGTYTVKTEEGKRIQISAGLMMPWYFIVASKED